MKRLRQTLLLFAVLAMATTTAFGQGNSKPKDGNGVRASVSLVCNLGVCQTTDTPWTLDKCEDGTQVCNGQATEAAEVGNFNWTVKADKGLTTAPTVTVGGYVSVTNGGGAPATIGSIIVNLQRQQGNKWVSAAVDVANSTDGNGATSAKICKQASSEGLETFTENSFSGDLTFTDANNNDVWSIVGQSIPANSTVDLLYTANFNFLSALSGQVRVEVIVTFGNSGDRGGGSSCSNVDINGNGVSDPGEDLVRSVPCRVTRTLTLVDANSQVVLTDPDPNISAASAPQAYADGEFTDVHTAPFGLPNLFDPLFPFAGIGTIGGVTYGNFNTGIGSGTGVETLYATQNFPVTLEILTGPDGSLFVDGNGDLSFESGTPFGAINNCAVLEGSDVGFTVDAYEFTCVAGVRLRTCAWPALFGGSSGGACGYSQGGWKNNEPTAQAFLDGSIYPVVIGMVGTYTHTFTSKSDVKTYLENNSGTPGALSTDLSGPGTDSSRNFGRQVLTITLNVLRDPNYGLQTYTGVAANTNSPWHGFSINTILADANTVLGGGASAYLATGDVPGALTDLLGQLVGMYHCN